MEVLNLKDHLFQESRPSHFIPEDSEKTRQAGLAKRVLSVAGGKRLTLIAL